MRDDRPKSCRELSELEQRFERFRQTNKTDTQCTVFQNFPNGVLHIQLFGIDPNTLGHEEGVIPYFFGRLNLEAVQQLPHNQIHTFIKSLVKFIQTAPGLYTDPGKIDGSKAQVAPAEGPCP